MEFPEGKFELYADDDDVIGLPVAKTYPRGWFIIRTNPCSMPAFDEFDVGTFLVECLNHHKEVQEFLDSE